MSFYEILGVTVIFAAGFACRHFAHKIPGLKIFFK